MTKAHSAVIIAFVVMRGEHTNRLRFLREREHLTLRELSAATGIDPSALSRMERMERGIPDAQKLVLAEFFEVSVDHLMAWDSPTRDNGNNHTRGAVA